jgi:hypothetical protein
MLSSLLKDPKALVKRRSSLFYLPLLPAAGCAQPPTHELELTAARVEAARNQEAAVFAPELFAEAERSLAEANRLASSEGDYLAAIEAAAHSTLRANEAFSRARGLSGALTSEPGFTIR